MSMSSAVLQQAHLTARAHQARQFNPSFITYTPRQSSGEGIAAMFPLFCVGVALMLTFVIFAGLCVSAMGSPTSSTNYYPSREGSWMPSQTPVVAVADR